MEFVKAVEVHQVYIIVFESHQDARRIGNGVICFLHDHAFQLSDDVSLLRFSRVGTYHATDNDVRMKVFRHHINRKIVIYSSVIRQYGVYFNGFEHARETHGSTHGISQITFLEDNRTFVIHIGRHAAERNEQIVKVSPTERSSLPEQFHKCQVHLQRVDHARRQKLCFYLVQRILQ